MQLSLRTTLSFAIILVLSSFRQNAKLSESFISSSLLSEFSIRYTVSRNLKNSERHQIPFTGNSYVGFKEALGFKESQGSYSSVNTLGYMGKYQFGKSTLAFFGQHNTDCFMNDPALQERIFYHNTARNKWILRRDIKRFEGLTINGILISESGILAAAHLAGAGNVKKYLRSFGNHNVSDAYDTNIEDYLKRFSGFDLQEVSGRKRVNFI